MEGVINMIIVLSVYSMLKRDWVYHDRTCSFFVMNGTQQNPFGVFKPLGTSAAIFIPLEGELVVACEACFRGRSVRDVKKRTSNITKGMKRVIDPMVPSVKVSEVTGIDLNYRDIPLRYWDIVEEYIGSLNKVPYLLEK